MAGADPTTRFAPVPEPTPSSPDRRQALIALGYGAASLTALWRWATATGASDATPADTADGGSSAGPSTVPAIDKAPAEPTDEHLYDVVIANGRVMDPESRYDRTASVGIDGGTIVAVKQASLRGRRTIDARGQVVAPGFIDVLSYEPDDLGATYKIGDGVTTNLGMHGINSRASDFFARYTDKAMVNFGGAFDDPWHRAYVYGIAPDEPATEYQIGQLAAELEKQLHEGWIGVDFEPEYTPGIDFAEMKALAAVAAKYGVPATFHGRYSAYGTNAQTLDEIIRVGQETGAAVHVEHIISTGGTWDMAGSLKRLDDARKQGVKITSCMYPYNFWATFLGSARFAPGWQERFRISYGDLQVAGTAERLTAVTFETAQAENLLAAAFAIPEEDVRTCLRDPTTMIGSDAILTDGNNHPRATGCFARTLGRYARDQKTISLMDALAKMTIIPARWLQPKAPALARKGRLQRGADADITVFDPDTVIDRSTVAEPKQFSAGIDWVLLGGQVVKTPEAVDTNIHAGKPIGSNLT